MRTSVAKGLVAAGLVLGTLGVVVEPAAAADAVQAPPVVYVPVNEGPTNILTGVDLFNGANRQVIIPADAEAEVTCDHIDEDAPDGDPDGATDGVPGPTPPSDEHGSFFTGGCLTIQLETDHGDITFPLVGAAGIQGGAEYSSSPGPGKQLNIFGTVAELNAALAAMTYEPDEDFESTADAFALGRFFHEKLILRIADAHGNLIPGPDDVGENPDDGTNEPVEIGIRVEQPNDPPEITHTIAPQPVPVAAGDSVSWSDFTDGDTHLVDLVDPDANSLPTEPDDVVLVVVWTDGDGSDGLVDLAGFASTSCVGAPSDLLTVGFCPSMPYSLLGFVLPDPTVMNTVIDSIEALFPGGAFDAPFADSADGINTPSPAIAFLADIGDDGDDGDGDDANEADNALDDITYTAPLTGDFDVTLNVAVTDLGNNGLPFGPGPDPFLPLPDLGFATTSWDIEVRDADNDAPSVTPSPAPPIAATELTPTPVSFTIADPDAECDLTITAISVSGGTLGGAPAVGTTGTPDALTALLTGLSFTPSEFTTHPGLGSVSVTVSDNGCGPDDSGDDLTGTGTATFQVDDDGQPDDDPNTEANDPPVLTAPASIAVTEGAAFDVPDADIDLADPDAASDDLTLTITPSGGTTNADGSTSGTVAELDALLDALTFTADQDVDADDELLTPGITLAVTDNGHNPVDPLVEGTDVATIDVTVADDDGDQNPDDNDPPVIVGPTDEVADEGVALAFGDFTVSDPDVGGGTMDLVIGVDPAAGTLNSPGGAGLTLAEVNDILDGLTFTPAQDADFGDEVDVAIGIAVDDNGNTGAGGQLSDLHVVLVDVTDDDEPPVNDAPVITGPVATAADESVATAVGDFTVTDPDVGAGLMDVTISVPAGTGALSSTGQNGIDLAAVNALLDGLTFTPVADADLDNEAVDITITVDDNGNTGTGGELFDTHVVAVTVSDVDAPQPPNDPPVLLGPTAGAATEGVPFAFDDFTVTDPDVDDGDGLLDLTLTSPVGAGTFGSASANGLTLAQVNTLLDDLTFTPAEDDADATDEAFQLTITVNDRGNFGSGGAKSDSLVIDLTVGDDDSVNGAPTLTGPGAQVVVEGGQLAFTGPLAITVDDPDAGGGDLLLQIEVTGAGDVVAAAVPDTIGTLAELQAVLDALVFTAGAPGAATITITVNDQGATGTGGAQSDTLVIPITVTAQAPTTTTSTTTTTPGGGGATTSTTAAVGAGGAGRGGTSLPRTGADLLLLAGAAVTLAGVGGLLTSRRPRARA